MRQDKKSRGKDNRIISQGYNGFLPGCPHKSVVRNNHEQATVHAEQNAICDCAKRGVSIDNAICYVTHRPCLQCYKALVSTGVSKIYYIDDYKNSDVVTQLSNITKVYVEKL